jgi:hypothetical protein
MVIEMEHQEQHAYNIYSRMRVSIIILLPLFIAMSPSFGQKAEIPKFKGIEKSFQAYISTNFQKADTSFSKMCNTSIGLIQFSIDKEGRPTSIIVSEGFPKEVSAKLFDIVSESKWYPLKTDKTLTIVQPLAIALAAGCKEGDIKRGFGVGGDFAKMLPTTGHPLYLNCILMSPFTYTAQKKTN